MGDNLPESSRRLHLESSCQGGSPSKEPAVAEGEDCEVFATADDGTRVVLYRGAIKAAKFLPYGDDLVEFTTSCGSPCHHSYFLDRRDGAVSRAFFNTVAIAERARLVAYSDGSAISVSPIFGERAQPRTFHLDAARSAAIVTRIEAARFSDDGTVLAIDYRADPDGEVAHAEFRLDPSLTTSGVAP